MTYVADPTRYDRYGCDAGTFRRAGRSGLDLPAISLGLWHSLGDDRTLDDQRAIRRRALLSTPRTSARTATS